MTALKTFRADLTAHLAAGLGATAPKLGALVNPPAVIVQSGTPYVAALDYCNDAITFEVTVVTKPGDPPAVVDALEDLIDLVRATLRTQSPGGHIYGFREVSGFIEFPTGEEGTFLPAVVISVEVERSAPI